MCDLCPPKPELDERQRRHYHNVTTNPEYAGMWKMVLIDTDTKEIVEETKAFGIGNFLPGYRTTEVDAEINAMYMRHAKAKRNINISVNMEKENNERRPNIP